MGDGCMFQTCSFQNCWHSSSFWFCPLFCPLLHLPIYFALKFCPCPCPLFCPENEGKPEGKGKGKIWGQNIWGNEEEGKIKEGKNTKFIWKNKWWPKNLVQQSQFPTFNEMLWNILRGQKDIWKNWESLNVYLFYEHDSYFHFSEIFQNYVARTPKMVLRALLKWCCTQS